MKKLFILVLALSLMFVGVALADKYEGGGTQDQNQIQGQNQHQGQDQSQIGINKNKNINVNENEANSYSRSSAYSDSNSKSSAKSSNVGIQEQGNSQSIGGDSTKTQVYANSWPALSGGVGVSQANAYSIFGGLGVSSTEEYKVCIEKLQVIDTLNKLGYLTKEEALAEVQAAFAELKYSTKSKRMLGILWKTSGRNLLNAMGLLSWDSFWKEGKTPADVLTTPKAKTTDTAITGNAGNVNQ